MLFGALRRQVNLVGVSYGCLVHREIAGRARQAGHPGWERPRARCRGGHGRRGLCAGRLTEHQLATLLGMDRYELDGFLKKREVWLDYTEGDLRREVEVGERLWKKRQDELDPSGQ
jgi:hypothetical protein